MSATTSEQLPETGSATLSAGEALFLKQLRELLNAAMHGRISFVSAMETLRLDLKEMRKHGFDVGATLASGFAFGVGGAAPPPSPPARAHLSDAERAFLTDMDGLIDYSVRNSITFLTLLRPITHDVAGLSSYGWSLEGANADCFLPAVSGWAERNLQPAGQADELE